MKITVNKIKKLNPCKNRLDNFLQHYPKFSGNLKQFIKLDNITFEDKVWTVTKLFNKKQNVQWSVLIAKSVFHNFKLVHEYDIRHLNAIQAADRYLKSANEKNKDTARRCAYAMSPAVSFAPTVNARSVAKIIAGCAWAASTTISDAASCSMESTICLLILNNEKKQENLILNRMIKCVK